MTRVGRNSVSAIRAITALPFVLWLSGCAETEPYQKAGMWQPTGANALNLAAMVQNPADLIRGKGARGFDAREAGAPVQRLLAGNPTPLPSSSAQSGASGPAAIAPPSGPN